MKLNNTFKKFNFRYINFIFVMLVIILTLFYVDNKRVKANFTTVEYNYTGDYQEFTANKTGIYKIELWGASGGYSNSTYAYGAYTSGDIKLYSGEKLYFFLGREGAQNKDRSYNGGGLGSTAASASGGATDVRYFGKGYTPSASELTWNSTIGLKSRIMVAAGGAGYDPWQNGSLGGAGGGLIGYDGARANSNTGITIATGATQTSGGIRSISSYGSTDGVFGIGGYPSAAHGSGGAGGYYGGGAGADGPSVVSAGSGGSSYISGHTGCVAITSLSNMNPKAGCETGTEDNSCSIHYSNRKFENTKMIDGRGFEWTNEKASTSSGMPSHDGSSTMTGNQGNGYAKIILLSETVDDDNTLTSLQSSKGSFTSSFDPSVTNYTLNIDKYDDEFVLTGETTSPNALTSGLNEKYNIEFGQTKVINVIVTSEVGTINTYKITVKRDNLLSGEHSSKLKKLEVNNFKLSPKFNPLTLSYTTTISSNEIDLNLIMEKFDSEATISVEGDKYIKESSGVVTITVKAPFVSDTVYTINYSKIDATSSNTFTYTGTYQEFITPLTGKYKIELWGASAGSSSSVYAYGGYTKGEIELIKNEKLYFYLGRIGGTNQDVSFNGGGAAPGAGYSGGGATDVRYFGKDYTPTENELLWNSDLGLKSRIMVAGAGAGNATWGSGSKGGDAGGLIGYNGGKANSSSAIEVATGGTQTLGGSRSISIYATGEDGAFGTAGSAVLAHGSGGGGGYYGGGAGADGPSVTSAGAGGSSYISGHTGCVAITSSTDINPKSGCETGTNDNSCSIHYSNKVFENTKMVDGTNYLWTNTKTKMMSTTIDTNGTDDKAHQGNGYAKITSLIETEDRDNYLTSMQTSVGTLSPVFTPTQTDYTLTLSKYDSDIEITGETSNDKAIVFGLNEKYTVDYGQTKVINIVVVSESGDIRIYTINAIREEMNETHSSKLSKLEIKDAELSPKFNSTTTNYNMTFSNKLVDLDIITETYDSDATVKIVGDKFLKYDTGEITITVKAPSVSDTIYTLNYEKVDSGDVDNYTYTGSYQKFTASIAGTYKVELWGASGGTNSSTYSYGGYTKGDIFLKENEELYLYLGREGANNTNASYNGGAIGSPNGYSGGGATDVRYFGENYTPSETELAWNSKKGLRNRIMVAGAGGGYDTFQSGAKGGDAGGLIGYEGSSAGETNYGDRISYATGGTQTQGGEYSKFYRIYDEQNEDGRFGLGGAPDLNHGSGGGAGYYGGGGGSDGSRETGSGAGGSSFISGHTGCVAIQENQNPKTGCDTGTDDNSCSIHYSNKIFTNTKMIDGKGCAWSNEKTDECTSEIDTNGSISSGHAGSGRAKITYITNSNDNYLLTLSSNYGELSPEFNPKTLNYNLELETYDAEFTLEGETSSELATVTGLGRYEIEPGETKKISVVVTAEDGSIKTYTIEATRYDLQGDTHNSKLRNLEINGYTLSPRFSSLRYEYEVKVPTTEIDLDIIPTKYDEDAEVTIVGNKHIRENTGSVTITVTAPSVKETVYTIRYTKVALQSKYDYSYTGEYKTFTVPTTGKYIIELWGAEGGTGSSGKNYAAGKGAYTKGEIELKQDTNLYVYVGQKGVSSTNSNAWNGGGYKSTEASDGSGGGATDIRLVKTSTLSTWNEFNSLKSRIMVAGAGGGSDDMDYPGEGIGGHGGGLEGISYIYRDSYTTATQTHAGSSSTYTPGNFGSGNQSTNSTSGGGGSGYYGGGSSDLGSMGGSSFISGHEGCDAVSEDSTSSNIVHTNQANHYSGLVFTNTKMISGDGYEWTNTKTSNKPGIQKTDSDEFETGHTGNGYARITPVLVNKNNYLLSLTTDYGRLSPTFDPIKEEYTLTLGMYDEHFTLSGTLSDENALVTGLETEHTLANGETEDISIIVTSVDGYTREYTIHVERPSMEEHSSKIKRLSIENYDYALDPEYHPLTETYDLNILSNEINLNIETETYDNEAVVTIEGNTLMLDDFGSIVITVKEPHVEDTIYTINYLKLSGISIPYNYDYTGKYQVFTAPYKTTYKFETWGAEGGNGVKTTGGSPGYHGKGAYASGTINLERGDKLYLYVGQQGVTTDYTGAWNGGGFKGDESADGSGGGATDIRLVKTSTLSTWNEFDSLKSRIMVAGAGGGSDDYPNTPEEGMGGHGGTINGITKFYGSATGTVTTQTTSGYDNSFESYKGGFGYGNQEAHHNAQGGGSGYYGGGASDGGSIGGSSFVSGCEGCNAISEESEENSIIHTNQPNHYSGKVFDNIVMKAGNEEMPTHNGEGTMVGNTGNGFAKITPILLNKNNYLASLSTDKGNINPVFDPTKEEYSLTLGVDDTKLKVNARPSSDLSTIMGIGEYDIPGGETQIPIVVTAESGDIRTYTLTVTRPKSSESKAKNIIITGLVDKVCDGHPGYCVLDQEFDEEVTDYYMTVPAGIRELEFTVDKKHAYETVVGEGVSKLTEEENVITIEITSEDESQRSLYIYHITRDLSDDNYIDKLKVIPIDENNLEKEEIDIGFHYLIEEYIFKVENDITKLRLEVTPDSEEANYIIKGSSNLEVGENKIDIEVTAINGEIRTYTLNVYRLGNDNPLLGSLEVKDKNEVSYALIPTFKDVEKNYVVTVENEIDKVNIVAEAQRNTTQVIGIGEKNLNVGRNTFTINTTAENGLTYNYEIVVIREKSRNNYLSLLEVSEGELSPEFNKEENNYSIEVEAHTKKLTINAEKEAETSSVSIIGNSNFTIGENEVIVRVTAEDGSTNDYVITVIKEGSDNNYLESLSVKTGETELLEGFDKEIEEYEINVENDITRVSILGISEDTLSIVEGNNTYPLASGNNEFTIRVISETGLIKEYTVRIIRDKNSDASLKGINLSSGNIYFSSDVYDYEIEVENDVELLEVEGIANVNTTQVEGNGEYELEVGKEKTITLTTLAEDGETTLTYTLKVTRSKNKNAYLSELTINNGKMKPEFSKFINEYEVKVLNEIESIEVYASPENELSNVVITKPEHLEEGNNEVRIIVTAESGDINTYIVNVIRKSIEDSSLKLSTLSALGCEIEFNEEIKDYECTVEYETSDTSIYASPKNEDDIVEGTGSFVLEVGENEFEVKVLDETRQKENIYTIKIERKESKETRLRNISVENHELNETYNKDLENYTLNTRENNLEINYEKMHEGQEVLVEGNRNLQVGENVIRIHVLAANKVDERDYYITVTKDKNNNAYLKRLEVENYEVSPEFNKGRYSYELEVENEIESINVIAETEEITTQKEGDGVHNLIKGQNEIKVRTMAEDGETEKEYVITVIRLGSRNANLKRLGVKDHEINPVFDKNQTRYSLVVPYEEENVEIYAETEEENALVSGDGETSLKQGVNEKRIIVTSENGEIKTYIIEITRNNPVTSKLKNIKVKNYDLDKVFDSEELNYTVIVDNEIESLELIIEKMDPESTYVVEGNNNFEIGENEVRIISTSSDNEETTTYTLNVVRQEYSNTYLRSLEVSEGELDPEFNKNTLSYEVEVDYEINQIEIIGEAENSEAVVSGNGIYDLIVGENNFKIIVNKSGIKRTYNVKVKRKGSNNANILRITSNLGEVEKISEEVYKLVVPYNTREITSNNIIVETEDKNAVVSKQTRLDLESTQVYKIRVTSEDGLNVKDYVVNIELDKSTNNYLKKLMPSIGTLSPVFDKEELNYKVEVLDTEEEIELEAETEDTRSTILNNSLVFDLEEYTNEIKISVQSEKGDIRIYKVIVEKSLTRKRTLKDIKITGIENIDEIYEYNETTYEYNITVPYEINEIGYEITKNHPSEKVKILDKNENIVNEYPLLVGENIYKVRVENSYNEYQIYTYKIERLKNTNNYLRSLRLISPEKELEDFDKEKLEYEVIVDYNYENISVEAIPEDEENATVRINGTTYLIEGEVNDVKIKVRAQNSEVREYIIHVIRRPENNNLLKTLTISSGDIYTPEPRFNPGITNYTLSVPSAIEVVKIEGIAEDEEAEVQGNGDKTLKIGLNKFEIKVVKENKEKVYTVNITRRADRNVYLKKLEVLNGDIEEVFDKTRGIYHVNVGNDKESLIMNIETEDPNAKIEIQGNNNLRYGENEVRIKVTSSDGRASKTYVLKVQKEGNPDNHLSELRIDKEMVEGFEEDKTEYTYEVEYEKDSILVEGKAKEITSTVIGEGYYSLEEGNNIITITVISQSGERKEYRITVRRAYNTNLKMLITDRGEIEPEFDKEVLEYEIEVENEIKDITVIGLAESNNATVEGNDKYLLNVGDNEIIIKVKNEEYEKDYKLNVRREGSNNKNLKYLTVAESILDKEYTNDEDEYEVYIPNDVNKLSLSYEPEDETTIVEEIGNENFTGNEELVRLRITSTNQTTREVKIRVIREDAATFSNKLLDLYTNKGTMSPRYTEDVQEYTVTVPSMTKEIQVTAVKRGTQTVEGVGLVKLDERRTVHQVKVTSKDGKTRIYTLIIYKESSKDARIEELEFNEGYLSPGFNKNVYNYNLTADSESVLISIKKIRLVDENASYEVTGGVIRNGSSLVQIKVTSADKTTIKTYKIMATLEKSNNAYLSNLQTSIGIINPEFNKKINTYEVEVGSNVNDIVVKGTSESTKAYVTGNARYDLNYGDNYINIVVTSEAGTTNTYSINVKRAYRTNVGIKEIYVRGYEISPEFDKEEEDYELEVENEVDKVEIGAVLEDEYTTVTGIGEKDLRVGENVFEVIGTTQNGEIKTYRITIRRKRLVSSKIERLEIKEGVLSPEFYTDYEYYSVNIPNENTKITPVIKLEDELATYEIIGNNNLKVGENEVQIKVTSENEETTYYITVIRQISSNNYLKTLTVSEGSLSPEFEKTEGYYEVNVENEVERITVGATAEINTTSIRGIGEYELSVGENKVLVETRSESGITRSYQIKITREGKGNTYLTDIRTSVGALSPEFDKEEGNYTIEVPEGTKRITLEGIKEEETSIVLGDGEKEIQAGENNINITVQAEDGSIRVYKVKVVRPLSSNTNITRIVPNDGELSPEYNNEVNEYSIRVGKDTNVLEFEIELESEDAKVKSGRTMVITSQEQEGNIIIEAEDKTIRVIKINIEKETGITDIEVEENNIKIMKTDTYKLHARAIPDENIAILYEVEDESVLSVNNEGLLTGLKVGTTKVKVSSLDNPLIEKEVQVTVLNNEIKTEELEIKNDEEKVIIGIDVGSTIKEFKEMLDNDIKTINIYDTEGNLLTDEDEVKTGLIIKLEYNEKVYDEAIMVVRGDVDGDGVVNVTDYMIVLNHALELEEIEDQIKFYAADVEVDDMINVTDYIKIMDYALENLDTLN